MTVVLITYAVIAVFSFRRIFWHVRHRSHEETVAFDFTCSLIAAMLWPLTWSIFYGYRVARYVSERDSSKASRVWRRIIYSEPRSVRKARARAGAEDPGAPAPSCNDTLRALAHENGHEWWPASKRHLSDEPTEQDRVEARRQRRLEP